MSLADSRWASPSTRPRSRYPSSTSTLHSSLTSHSAPSSTASRAPNNDTTTSSNTAIASATTTSSTPTNTHRLHDLALCTRLLRRLKWKAELLLMSHRYVVSSTSTSNHSNATNHTNHSTQNTVQDDALRKEATTMFKLDFFEFFVLLERCIALLLACLRIPVPRTGVLATSTSSISSSASGASSSTTSTPTSTTGAGDDGTASEKPIFATRGRTPHPLSTYTSMPASTSTTTPLITSTTTSASANPYTHRYHAALLSTLDAPSNPLHSVLGVGDVRRYLGIAKECRNKWKTAGEAAHTHTHSDTQKEGDWEGGYPVESLELERMLPCVLEALDRARDVTEGVVKEAPKTEQARGGGQDWDGYMGMDMDVDVGVGDDGAWEAVPDAMEWE